MFDRLHDAEIDCWNDAALDALRGNAPRSTNPLYMEGYVYGQRERKVRPVMVRRPEGYYHAPIGTFD